MQFDVFTLLPEVMRPYLEASILGKAQEGALLMVRLHNIRDWTTDRHHTTDDEPYGGGGGMVMKPEPIFAALEGVLGDALKDMPVILLSPQGRVFHQRVAHELTKHERIALICGRYEGVDDRVRQHLATDEISVGDYVLTGGELPALLLIDAVVRLLPGVLGDANASVQDSHAAGLLEHPHYTRPPDYRGWKVPEVLLSGDHARIAAWRRREALRRTWQRRRELLENAELSAGDRIFLREVAQEQTD
jgi:tRNA (guanine37-N1)-methyltransferase